jgi:hypothetical protein
MDRWALPGPAHTVAGVAVRLASGEHIVFYGSPDFELRLALEPRLTECQRHLRTVSDDPCLSPAAVLWRETVDWHLPGTVPTVAELAAALGRDTWWIQDIAPSRGIVWSAFLAAFAEVARNVAPRNRPTIVLFLPEAATGPTGLTICQQGTPRLSRGDLDVAARYATASLESGISLAVRISLAVEIATGDLPGFAALDTLQIWLDAPSVVLADAEALAKYAGGSMSSSAATLLLWRSQCGPVTYAIDQARCAVLRAHARLWRVPHIRPPEHAFPTTIEIREQLEISDLIDQLSIAPRSLPMLLTYLKDLRHARNKLSHLTPVTAATFQVLARSIPQ